MVMDPRPGFMLFGSFIQPDDSDPHQPLKEDYLALVKKQKHNPPIKRLVIKLSGKPPQSRPLKEDEKKQNQNQNPHSTLRCLLLSMGVAKDHTPTHFFTRTLFASDVKKGLTRLTIPRKQLLTPFLTDQEEALLQERDLKKLEVAVVDPSLKTRILTLSRWNYKKSSDKGTRSWSYALNGGWMDLVYCNGLAKGDPIQVWSFRMMDASLGFIIFKVETPSATYHGSSSSEQDNEVKGSTTPQGWGLKRKRGSNSSLSTPSLLLS